MAQLDQGNPFAAPPAAAPNYGAPTPQQTTQSGNPFDPFSAQPPSAVPQADPFSSAPAVANASAAPPPQPSGNPFAASPPSQGQGLGSQPQLVQGQEPTRAPQQQMSPPQHLPQQAPQPQVFPPPQTQQVPQQTQQQLSPPQQPQLAAQTPAFPQQYPGQPQQAPQQTQQQQYGYSQAGVGAGQQPQDPFSNALVPSQQPSNPYAGYATPMQQHQQPVNPFGGAPVPTTQQHQSPGGVAPSVSPATSFDPFAPPPPPAPAPPPTDLVPTSEPQPYYEVPTFVPQDNEQAPPPQHQQPEPSASSSSVGPPVNEVNAVRSGHSVVSEPETTLTRRSDDRDREIVPYRHEPEKPIPEQNRYSRILAQNAPPGCSPLPKAEMVLKSGYILARISFRTILIKKWKQTYWIQYGRHTMIWFRSENHFNEWLSNPYLSQAQRNFLVKLAVNFVHDLYKPNVRGYQVTQAHTKPYGRKLLRQFKLERWMDYGPTIAAAFGSPDHKECDELRQTIIQCMRNTPLEGGLRATGAVRQRSDEQDSHRDHHYDDRHTYDDQYRQNRRDQPYGDNNSYDDHYRHVGSDGTNGHSGSDYARAPVERSASAPTGGQSTVSAPDLLDDQGYTNETSSYDGGYQSYAQAPAPQQMPPQPHMNHQYAGYR